MSSADRIAETILRMGQIRAEGLQRSADIQARAQQNNAQIWSGALQSLGQLPVDIQKAKVLDTENQIRQGQLDQQKKFQNDLFNANEIYQFTTRPGPDGSVQFDEDKLPAMVQKMTAAGINPDVVEHFTGAYKGMNQTMSGFRDMQLKHQADFANYMLQSASPEHPLTPATSLAAAKVAQANGLANTDDINKMMAAFNQGKDPTEVFKAIANYGKQPQKPALMNVPAGNTVIDENTRQPVFTAPGKPEAPKVPNTRYEALYSANVKDPAHPTNDELAIVDAKMKEGEAPKNDDEFQTFKKAYAKKLIGPNGQWDQLTPDQQIAGNSAYTVSKADPATRALAESNAQIRNLLLQSQLGNQPTKDDASLIAKQIIDHKMAPSQITLFGGMGQQGSAFKRMVGTEALKLDPNFDWEQAESDYQFGKSPGFQSTVRYIQSIGPDMERLKKNADALANGDVRSVNALINAGKNQVNNVDLKKYQTDRLLVADVIAKIMQGGGTGAGTSDAKLKQAGEILKDSDSPAAISAALGEALVLIGNREKTLTRGTYMERQAKPAETPAAPKYTVGQTVIYNGQRRKVASINPDGTATLAPGVVP